MEENKIAKQLKLFRNANNLTAKQVSCYLQEQGLYVEARSIYDYESGNRINVFLYLCHLYGCTDVLHEFGYDNIKAANVADELDVVNQYKNLQTKTKKLQKAL